MVQADADTLWWSREPELPQGTDNPRRIHYDHNNIDVHRWFPRRVRVKVYLPKPPESKPLQQPPGILLRQPS